MVDSPWRAGEVGVWFEPGLPGDGSCLPLSNLSLTSHPTASSLPRNPQNSYTFSQLKVAATLTTCKAKMCL